MRERPHSVLNEGSEWVRTGPSPESDNTPPGMPPPANQQPAKWAPPVTIQYQPPLSIVTLYFSKQFSSLLQLPFGPTRRSTISSDPTRCSLFCSVLKDCFSHCRAAFKTRLSCSSLVLPGRVKPSSLRSLLGCLCYQARHLDRGFVSCAITLSSWWILLYFSPFSYSCDGLPLALIPLYFLFSLLALAPFCLSTRPRADLLAVVPSATCKHQSPAPSP